MSSTTANCRSCGSADLKLVLSLGRTPLANRLLTDALLGEKEPIFPLELFFCPKCSLVQITESVPPEVLFSDYLYFSSFSDALLTHARGLVADVRERKPLGQANLVVEVASNDGYLLQYYRDGGVPVLGIEPAQNIAKVAVEKGIPTRAEFFGDALASRLRSEGVAADVIHANNVIAHVPDINGFVEGFRILLADDGIAVVETPYVKDMIDHREFDTIYHEHLFYYSLTAFQRLFNRHGLRIQDVHRVAIHGGTLRIFAVHEASSRKTTAAVTALLREEQAWGVDRLDGYAQFGERVANLRLELTSMLRKLKADGHSIAAYGAAAKGSTLLNYFGIGHDLIDFVVDRSTYKQGKYMPGVHIPILPPEALLERTPDYVLLLTWNFATEIIRQQDAYRQQGGKFIVPIPELKVV